jgi:hypothetical protein
MAWMQTSLLRTRRCVHAGAGNVQAQKAPRFRGFL